MGEPKADRPISTPRRRRLRYWPVAVTLAVGCALTLGMFTSVEQHQSDHRQQRFKQQAYNAATAVRSKLAEHLEILYSVRDLFGASTDVTRSDFHRFAGGQRSRLAGNQAIEWIPRVLAPERPAFERAARQAGLEGFQLTELTPDGRLHAAGQRAEYFPVYYVEPLAGNEQALGYAPLMPTRDAAIEQAWSTGQAAATGRFRLLQEPGNQYGLAIFVPIFRGGQVPATLQARHDRLLGLVEGVYRLDDMIHAATEGLDLSGLGLSLTDESAWPADRGLAALNAPHPGDATAATGSAWHEAFDMGGRRWVLRVYSHASKSDPFDAPWPILPAGMLMTGLAGAYHYNLMSRKADIEREVELRTAELSHATQELRRSEGTLRAVITNATDVIFIKDLAGVYVLANPEVCRILGMPLERVIGATDEDLFPPEVAELNRAEDRQALDLGQPQTSLLALDTAAYGRRVFLVTKFPYLAANGETIGVTGIARDITPLQQAEAALREERDRAQRYLDVAGVMIVVIDPEGRLSLANRKAGEILGCDPLDMMGQPWFETFVSPKDREDAREAFRAVVARGEPASSHFEHLVRARHGAERRIVWQNVTLHDPRGRIVGLLCSGSDVTDYKRAIEEVAHREAELAQAREIDRLKTNFVSSISHDLRTPLTSIKGYAEFLVDGIGGDLTSQQQEFVAQIERGTRRLENLVDDLLDFARFDAGTFTLRREEVDLGRILQEVAASLQPQLEENRLHLTLSLPEEPLEASLDQKRIERVLANLLSNAVKFTPPGGEIRLGVERLGGELRCEVTDSGPGIERGDQSRLFQRFSQLATGLHKGGTGLGLSISKAIIEAHGGAIGVSSDLGAGATFWFTLPAARSTLVSAEGAHHPPDHGDARQ